MFTIKFCFIFTDFPLKFTIYELTHWLENLTNQNPENAFAMAKYMKKFSVLV
jgi:hypothetical protein